MSQLSAKSKVIILLVGFVIFAVLMFFLVYPYFDKRNKDILAQINTKKLDLIILEREQKNFKQARTDIEDLRSKDYPPQELFSRDTKVVKEIKVLEGIANDYNLDFSLQVNGGVEDFKPVEGLTSELFIVPYSVTLEGAYNNVLKYLGSAQKTSFINHTTVVSIRAIEDGLVEAIIESNFYLQE
ncbi:MAG: hypothetical protein R3B41_02630 [Candidatus Doudnabacteria bacterium]